MSTEKLIQPNRLNKAKEALAEHKGLEVPKEIRQDEAHLTHLLMVKSSPNFKTFEFEHTIKHVKVNTDALNAAKDAFMQTEGTVVILHDGEKYQNSAAGQAAAKQEEASAATSQPEANKADAVKDEYIKQLEAKLEALKNGGANISEGTTAKKQEANDEFQKNSEAANVNPDAAKTTTGTTESAEADKAAAKTTSGKNAVKPEAENAAKKGAEADKAAKVDENK